MKAAVWILGSITILLSVVILSIFAYTYIVISGFP